MAKRTVRITHKPSGTLIAEGPVGWGITPFEGNYYIGRKYLKTSGFKANYVPGLCIYKFLYVWLDFKPDTRNGNGGNGAVSKFLGWMYWLPNPLFPFIWFRVAVPQHHSEIAIENI